MTTPPVQVAFLATDVKVAVGFAGEVFVIQSDDPFPNPIETRDIAVLEALLDHALDAVRRQRRSQEAGL